MFLISVCFQRWNSYLLRLQLISRKRDWAVWIAIFLVRCYKLILSPLIGPACRFSPSCSQYAIEALDRHGLVKGIHLAIRRLLRCHPWNDGGYDPVP